MSESTRSLTSEAITVDNKDFNMGMRVSDLYSYVDEEIKKYGHRTKDLEEKSFDGKFAAHLFRLYFNFYFIEASLSVILHNNTVNLIIAKYVLLSVWLLWKARKELNFFEVVITRTDAWTI